MSLRKLPDGTVTSNTDEYLDAWNALTHGLEDTLALRCISFDPSMLFVDATGSSVEIPVWLGRIILRGSKRAVR